MKVLIVDDQPANKDFLIRVLHGHNVIAVTDPFAAERRAMSESFDLLITSQNMNGRTGLELITRIKMYKNDFLAIIQATDADIPNVVSAINDRTVFRYIGQPVDSQTIRNAVTAAEDTLQQERRRRNLELELAELNAELHRLHLGCDDENHDPFLRFVGESPGVRRIVALAKRYALTHEAVLITGETGTGKEILARAIHDASDRNEGPYVVLNCSAFSEHLIESELFGHRKGAYTDAREGKKGLVELADGGTLFLDEIGDFPVSLQPKILRFIQHGTFLPVGSTEERHVDVRIISATNRDLRALIEDGRFRRDLFYRINTLELKIPPVRKRASDIPLLLDRIASLRGYLLPPLPDTVLRLILAYPFPGNVREIEALAARFSVHHRLGAGVDELETLVQDFTMFPETNGDRPPTSGATPLEIAEIDVIQRTLRENRGNLTRTAQSLGLSRQGLRDKLKRYGLYNKESIHR